VLKKSRILIAILDFLSTLKRTRINTFVSLLLINGISVKFSLRFTSYNFNNIAQTNSTRYQQVEPVVIFINNSYAHTV